MPEPVDIAVSPTPNPHAMKFTLNRTVAAKGETYRGDPAAVPAAWAKALLAIPGIVGVYGVNNFISANKTPDASWDDILPKAESALRRAFQ
ncbi:MAG: NifU N-terminal domain-containing protein [Candidatus Omnitrophica bacterium]|nr:NifU N-terminal domain-containing protein [Candidatus Omnitrophota bacterium]